jgi:hypothetical protein
VTDPARRLRMVQPGGLWLGVGQQHRAPTAADLAAHFRERPDLLAEVVALLPSPSAALAALAALHRAVGPALDGLDPEAVLRERAEERR